MIVTCENCGARYKLDDAKVSGRGVKITCPKCRHIFVVFRDQQEASTPSALGPMSLVPEFNYATRTLPPDAAPSAPRRDVNELDFRKVGIASWKVKVKIGLVYDFSDYKTLRKYIQDGRVTASDTLSYDGKIWTPIGDIPDLERHFVDVYEAAEVRKAEEESQRPAEDADAFSDEGPTGIHGMADVATNLGNAARAEASRAETQRSEAFGGPQTNPPRTVTGSPMRTLPPQDRGNGASRTLPPVDRASPRSTLPPVDRPSGPIYGENTSQRRKKRHQGARTTQQTAKKERGFPTGAIAVVGILALVGGWLYLNRSQGDGLPPVTAPSAAAAPAQTGPTAEQIRKQMRDELRKELDAAPPPEPIQVDAEPQLIPVRPKDLRPNGSSGAQQIASRPATAPPAAPPGIESKPQNAKDNADVGDGCWSRGDYAGALAAYRAAATMEPSSATYAGKVGRALYKTGDLSNAKVSLTAARRGGYTEASKWLGNIARDQGDVAGAIGNYNDYLKGSPSDAAEIRHEIETLQGS